MSCPKHMSLPRILVNCCAENRWGRQQVLLCPLGMWCEHNKTVFDKAAGELIGRLEVVWLRSAPTDMLQLAKPFCALVNRCEIPVHRRRSRGLGLRSSARLPPAASRIQWLFQVFDEDLRPVLAVRRVRCAISVHRGISKHKLCAFWSSTPFSTNSLRQCSAAAVLQELV